MNELLLSSTARMRGNQHKNIIVVITIAITIIIIIISGDNASLLLNKSDRVLLELLSSFEASAEEERFEFFIKELSVVAATE